jgi:hypothetical protein
MDTDHFFNAGIHEDAGVFLDKARLERIGDRYQARNSLL